MQELGLTPGWRPTCPELTASVTLGTYSASPSLRACISEMGIIHVLQRLVWRFNVVGCAHNPGTGLGSQQGPLPT